MVKATQIGSEICINDTTFTSKASLKLADGLKVGGVGSRQVPATLPRPLLCSLWQQVHSTPADADSQRSASATRQDEPAPPTLPPAATACLPASAAAVPAAEKPARHLPCPPLFAATSLTLLQASVTHKSASNGVAVTLTGKKWEVSHDVQKKVGGVH